MKTCKAVGLSLIIMFAMYPITGSTLSKIGKLSFQNGPKPFMPTSKYGPECAIGSGNLANPDEIAKNVDMYLVYSYEPAPMGIADYGIMPSNGSAYWYNTTSFLGTIVIDSLSTNNGSGDPWASFQLNVNTEFKVGSIYYDYWLQDVMEIDTSSNYVYFFDNIWNSSSTSAEMSGLGVSGNGTVNSSGSDFFYYDWASDTLPGNEINLTYPSTVLFEINATVDHLGRPMINFAYDDGFGWQIYDKVTFLINPSNLVANWALLVDGTNYTPSGSYYDAELILGGAAEGYNTTDVISSVDIYLDYYKGHGMQTIPAAYNFGSDTAEGISNVVCQANQASNGNRYCKLTAGAGLLDWLWDPKSIHIYPSMPLYITIIIIVIIAGCVVGVVLAITFARKRRRINGK
ncbi:MAG TPA: thermopsin [Candidatus Lokiarchaeia archaeon]|nr:thermopsin [Candidatus Lokiarchaeia archaeon]